MLTKQYMTNCTLFLLFFEEINVIAKCGKLSSVQLQNVKHFYFFCMYIMLLHFVHKSKCEINFIILSN